MSNRAKEMLNKQSLNLIMPKDSEMDTKGLEALREMQRISALNGNCNMTLEEINAEIKATREVR